MNRITCLYTDPDRSEQVFSASEGTSLLEAIEQARVASNEFLTGLLGSDPGPSKKFKGDQDPNEAN